MEAASGLSALALLGGMGLALTALPAGAQQITCASNSDGMVHATEAATYAAQRFDQAADGRDKMTQERPPRIRKAVCRRPTKHGAHPRIAGGCRGPEAQSCPAAGTEPRSAGCSGER
jgi:hypothetical protein